MSERQIRTEADDRDRLEQGLAGWELPEGETMLDLFRLLGRKIELKFGGGAGLLIVDVVSEPNAYDRVVDLAREYFRLSAPVDLAGSDYETFKRAVSQARADRVLLRDRVTAASANHAGWIHSQDQGFKSAESMQAFIRGQGKLIFLLRHWDEGNETQRGNILGVNDFNDALVYLPSA